MSPQDTQTEKAPLPPAVPVQEVEVTALGGEKEAPVIPPDRRISVMGWLAAIAIFCVNRKLGLVLVVILLVFMKFPAINMKSLARKAGKLLKKANDS